MRTLAQRLRHYRNLRGLSAEKLARLAGLSLRTELRYEHGDSRPDAARLCALAHALGVDPTSLIPRSDSDLRERVIALAATLAPRARRGGTGRVREEAPAWSPPVAQERSRPEGDGGDAPLDTPLPPLREDPLWGLVGAYDADPADIDEVVYGARRRRRKPS